MRPAIDSAIPPRSLGIDVGHEPAPAVADVHRDRVRLDLLIDGDHGRARVARRVGHRLPRRQHERLEPIVERAVAADVHGLDRYPVLLLDGDRDRLERFAEIEVDARRRATEEPRPQLALLAPGQADHRTGVVGPALDEREGLQDGVVEVRRHLGPFVGADALTPLLDQRGPQPPQPGSEDEAQPAEHDGGREQSLTDGAERALRREERADAPDDERAPDDDPGDGDPVRRLASGRVVTTLPPHQLPDELVDRTAAPPDEQRGTERAEHDRPHERARHPDTGRLGEEQDAQA